MVPMSALRAPLLHGSDVRVELLLLVGVQDGSERRDLLITLTLLLPANLFHLRARGGGVAALARFTRFLHGCAELLAGLLHLRLLLLADCRETVLLCVGQVDALEEHATRAAATSAVLTIPLAMVALGGVGSSIRCGLRGSRTGGADDEGQA